MIKSRNNNTLGEARVTAGKVTQVQTHSPHGRLHVGLEETSAAFQVRNVQTSFLRT